MKISGSFTLRRFALVRDKKRRADVAALFTGRSRAQTPPPFPPPTLSHYKLVKPIGNGSKGMVYQARDQRLDRLVALKVLRGWQDPESVRRFLREARCASAIDHPNVVTIYECDSDQGIDFIVMEYVAGPTLDRAYGRRGLNVKMCLEFAIQIARALAALHANGMIHRDIKPSNFIVTKRGVVKLLDFGLAKSINISQLRRSSPQVSKLETQDGTIMGTWNYMSPEQARGKPADCRSDVFSFGVVLYEMLTGRCPFQERTLFDTMKAIRQKPMPPLPPNVPRDLAAIVRRCLQKNPDRRYKSAVQLPAALMRVAARLNS